MHVQNLMNSLWDIRIFLCLVPKESPCIIHIHFWVFQVDSVPIRDHLKVFYFITPITFGAKEQSWSSSLKFLQSPATSSVFRPDTILRTLLSSHLKVADHVTNSYTVSYLQKWQLLASPVSGCYVSRSGFSKIHWHSSIGARVPVIGRVSNLAADTSLIIPP